MFIQEIKKLHRHVFSALLLILVTTLTACGGGSSGGGAPALGTDYLCGDHVTTETNVTGNNTYEFIASDGECFGTTEDHNLVKQEVPVEFNTNVPNTSLVSLTATAKLTSEQVTYVIGGAHIFHIALDLTNTSALDLCIDFAGAILQDASDTEIAEVELDIFGDMYFGETSLRNSMHNDCIPAGETRTVWGDEVVTNSTLPANGIASLDHIAIRFDDIHIPQGDLSDDFFLDAISPTQAIWSTESQDDILGSAQYGYTIVNSFINMTDSPVVFNLRRVDIVYFDDDGYIVFSSSSTIDDYLGIDDDDLTDADYRLDASGGMLSVQDEYTPIVPALGATNIVGRAAKVVVGLDICQDVTTLNQCRALQ